MAYIAVYGTLKRGFRNNVLLQSAKFLKEVKTKPLYKMYKVKSGNYPFPALVKSENGVAVECELYEVDDSLLKRLDQLEGVPYLYDRAYVEIEDFNSMVIGYLFQQKVDKMEDCGTSWK